tara:strand:+ start:515 stop:619 length:105 start_codon:yes stop_codon:yes gene_type:complete
LRSLIECASICVVSAQEFLREVAKIEFAELGLAV